MTQPDPPVNVRVVLTDGRQVPVECAYVGFVGGLHRWEAVAPAGGVPDHVAMDKLPARTTVDVFIARDP